jgi:hypothetical protein
MGLELNQAGSVKLQLIQASKSGDLSLYREAQEQGKSFSQVLEEYDPSTPDQVEKGFDAFRRQLVLFDLIGKGITVDHFFIKNAMILLPEFMQREITAGYQGVENPESLVAAVVAEKGPKITPIYLKTTNAKKHLAKGEEAAAYPKTIIAYRDKALGMLDRGREWDFTYKVLRNQQLTEFKVFCQYIGAQIAYDEIDEIYTTGISGDGTSPAATDTGVASAGTLAYNDLVTHAMAFTAPAQLTHILAPAAAITAILKLTQFQNPDVWVAINQIQKSEKLTGLLPMNAKLVVAPNGTASTLCGIDARFAFRETVAQPLMIEADKIIEQKIEKAVISKESVYSVLIDDAIKKCYYGS